MINFPVSDWMPDAKIPSGPIQDKWSKYKLESKPVSYTHLTLPTT